MSKSMMAPSSPLGGSGDMPVEVYGLGGSPRRNAWKGWRLSPVCAWTVGLTIVVVFLCEAIILVRCRDRVQELRRAQHLLR